MIVSVCADKSSPGVTTLSLALASVWPGERAVLEADPSGGDLLFRMRAAATGAELAASPSLATLVSTGRLGAPRGGLLPFTQMTTLGVPVVAAEPTAEQIGRLRQGWPAIAAVAASWSGTAIADLGAMFPGSPAGVVAKASRLVLLLVPHTVDGLFRMRRRVVELANVVGEQASDLTPRIQVVLTGEDGNMMRAMRDARAVLDTAGSPVEVVGYWPRDRRAVAALWAGEMSKRLGKSKAIQAVTVLAERLLATAPELAGTPQPAPPIGTAPPAAVGPVMGDQSKGGW